MKAFKALLGIVCGVAMFGCTAPAQQEVKADEGKNAVIETIMTRRSVRKYQPQAVNRDTMQVIVECGINAPNAINRQAWEIRIVDNPEVIKKLTDLYVKDNPKEAENPNFQNMFRNAPAVIFIAHKPGRCTQVDCGLMAGNMVLAAKSLGLGTCCMMGPLGFFSTPEGKEFLSSMNLSEGYELLLSVGVGYPDEEPAAKPRNKEVIKFVE